MRGDLHTLKRVCEYASKVMRFAEFVIAVIVIATIGLGAASLFSEQAKEIYDVWVMGTDSDSIVRNVAAFLETLMIWVMGFITIKAIHDIMCSIRDEHSPFTEINTARMKMISLIYLGSSFIILLLEALAGRSVFQAVFVFLGCLLISVVMYCLALMCRYGTGLQRESDETL